MKKATNILFLVGGIVSAVMIFVYLLVGVIYILGASPVFCDMVTEMLENGQLHTSLEGVPVEEIVSYLQATFLVIGVCFMVLACFAAVNCVMSFIARKKQSKAVCVLNIVFGVLSSVIVNIVGGVFGIILASRQENSSSRELTE